MEKLSQYARYILPARLLYIIARIVYLTNYVLASICLLLSFQATAQLANSNFGLRNQVGITLNHEYSQGKFDVLELQQHHTNLQASLPVFLKIDTTGTKTKVHYLKAEYTFRKTNNLFNTIENEDLRLPNDFYSNGLTINYLHTISYPWMMNYNLRVVYAGDYKDFNPININATTLVLYKWNKNLVIGAGLSYQHTGFDDERFIFVPFIDWRTKKHWFVDMTSPNRLLIGKQFGRDQKTQLAWGTYLEFLTRYSYTIDEQKRILAPFELASGLDFRTALKGQLYFNAFIGNHFYKKINIQNNDFNDIEDKATHIGLNIRIGLSLNLQE